MTRSPESTRELSTKIRNMYSRFPFPNRFAIPGRKSDSRYLDIYSRFLNVPVEEFRDTIFLDAGCGTGDVTWSWRRLLDPSNQVLAIDISNTSIKIARDSKSHRTAGIEFSIGSVMDLALPDESIDIVHCSGVLVAVPDPDRAFQELVRVLKPGGYILLALYHKYGRMAHGFKRRVVDILEPEDIDRRAKIGGILFRQRMKKFEKDEKVPFENILYDQFGLPTESRYSVEDALKWFSKAEIEYTGSWPPVEWSYFGNALRISKQFEHRKSAWWYRMLLEVFPANPHAPESPPDLISRIGMQFLWFLNQLQLFSIAGRKAIKE